MRCLVALVLAVLCLAPAATAQDLMNQTYIATVVGTAATASLDLLNVFNATGSGRVIRIVAIRYTPSNAAAVTSGLMAYATVSVTSTAGATCTAVTIRKLDSNNVAVPSQVTAGTNCSTDPTVTFNLFGCATMTEESVAVDDRACYLYIANAPAQPITLREGQGIMVKTTALSAVGAVTVAIEFVM